jgi:hypothetical protein
MRVRDFIDQHKMPRAGALGPAILRSVQWVERVQADPTINLQLDDSRGRLVLCLLVPRAQRTVYRRLYAVLQGSANRSLADIEDAEMPPPPR